MGWIYIVGIIYKILISTSVISVNSYSELASIINCLQEMRGLSSFQEVYRGQGKDNWKLLPKIARKEYSPEIIETLECKIISDFYCKLECKKLLDLISSRSQRGLFESNWLLIQQAQHFGLPTRFLDWTKSWEVALYFAVSDEKEDIFNGQFWIYMIPPELVVSDDGQNDYLEKDPYEFEKTIFLNPAIHYSENAQKQIAIRRKGTQNGLFCVQPYSKVVIPLEDQDEHRKNIHKIIIPSKFKKNIREELKVKGITNDALYVLDPLNLADSEELKKAILEVDLIVNDLCRKYDI